MSKRASALNASDTHEMATQVAPRTRLQNSFDSEERGRATKWLNGMPSKASACKPWRSHKEDAIKTLLEVLQSKTFIMMKVKNMVMIAISLLMTIQTQFERNNSKQILPNPEV